jgi:predicted DsbA family dithiol-disulfide isomerase
MRIDIWSDLVCPWCYLGKRRLEKALEGFAHRGGVELVHRAFELDPERPRGETFDRVWSLAKKYRMTQEQAQEMEAQMEQRAAADGLEYHLAGGVVGNTFDAHRLLRFGRAAGREQPLLERLYRAHFTEQRSIFDPASLAALAAEAGLDAAAARRALDEGAHADEVRADERLARELGITGVPFFVLGGRHAVSGAQPAEALAEALAQAWADPGPSALGAG